jgi:hypothetical protein
VAAKRRQIDDLLCDAIARGETLKRACVAVGVSERTGGRRWADASFRKRIEERRSQLLQAAGGRLVSCLNDAIDHLHGVVMEGDDPRLRLAAAKAVVELALKHRTVVEIESRLDALEQAEERVAQLEQLMKSGGRSNHGHG